MPEAPVSIPDLIRLKAREYGLNEDHMLRLANCESGFVPRQSRIPANGPNGREDSWGVFQIHLPAHPSVSREEAMDVEFSLEWTALNLKEGRARMWTCARDHRLFGL